MSTPSKVHHSVKWWASSPLIGAPLTQRREHLVLMTVTPKRGNPQTVRIGTFINAAVAKRVADLLQTEEAL